MEITILDGHGINPGDLDFAPLAKLGQLTVYGHTDDDQIVERARQSTIVIVNKVHMSRSVLNQLPKLSAICLFATGYDNIDVAAAKEHGVAVYNAKGYGTESVAQHAMAMILSMTNRVEAHHASVMAGDWHQQKQFSYSLHTLTELKGKRLGIIGYGSIGQRLAEMARSFGMQILVPDRGKQYGREEELLPLDQLFRSADFVSLHAPLTDETRYMINRKSLSTMPPHCLLINTGRGDLVNESELAEALNEGVIAGAALDVVSIEPPNRENPNPLFAAKNCLITPHMAWRSIEARSRLLAITVENITHHRTGTETHNQII